MMYIVFVAMCLAIFATAFKKKEDVLEKKEDVILEKKEVVILEKKEETPKEIVPYSSHKKWGTHRDIEDELTYLPKVEYRKIDRRSLSSTIWCDYEEKPCVDNYNMSTINYVPSTSLSKN